MNANINIINDVLDVFRGVPCYRIYIQFYYYNIDGVARTVMDISLTNLLCDWYGDCDFCPSNDTKVHNLRITDGITTIKLTIGDLDFEELMDCVEKRMGII